MKIKFENLQSGWVDFTLRENGETLVQECFSSIPYDSFDDLIAAIDALRNKGMTREERRVVFNTEPYEYEMTFRGSLRIVELKITGYPDHRRAKKGQEIYQTVGSYPEVCLPFWRALRALQGIYSESELNHRWQREFPSRALDRLTQKLKIDEEP